MKIQLETIPVWDGVKSGDECFLCSLMERAEKDAVSYYLSSAIMTPEVRVQTNHTGFCPHHLELLAEGGKAQSLALVMDTYYEELLSVLSPSIDRIVESDSRRRSLKALKQFDEKASKREHGCLVCSRMKEREDRYAYTVASLWNEDGEFRNALSSSKGFCIHHTRIIASFADQALPSDRVPAFLSDLFTLLRSNLERVKHDAWYLTQMYKSENRGKSWEGCEDAHRRAALKLSGVSRVLDPS